MSPAQLSHVAAAMVLVDANRTHGHLAAHVDPLGSAPRGDPALDPASLGLTPEAMTTVPTDVLHVWVPGATLAEALPHLQGTDCGTLAYEVEHVSNHQERAWLRQVIESGAHRTPLDAEAQRRLLQRLTEVESLERFLHKAYLGQKRFSIEGVDMMVPMLDLAIEMAADTGAAEVVLGLAVIAMAAMARCASQWHPALRRTAILLACSILAGIDVGVSGLHGEAAQKTFFAALLGIALVVVAARHAPAAWRRRWLGEGQS